MIDLSSQGSCRPSWKQNRRLFQNKNKVNYRTSITAIEHTLSWTYSCSSLVDRKVLMWLTWSVHKVRLWGWEIMSEHPIKCFCDGFLLYDTRLCWLEWLDMAIYIWWISQTNIYSSLCKVETATRHLKFFSWSFPECFTVSVIRRGWDLFSNQI